MKSSASLLELWSNVIDNGSQNRDDDDDYKNPRGSNMTMIFVKMRHDSPKIPKRKKENRKPYEKKTI